MLAIVGTIPSRDVPVLAGVAELRGDQIHIGKRTFPVNRGTLALLAATAAVCSFLGLDPPFAYLAGDIGQGDGSRLLYQHLVNTLPGSEADLITFHYLQPDADWHARVLFAAEEMPGRPILIADAGFMYAAKMSGQAEAYDLFTPDIGELAFLADEEAPHPFYTRGFILHQEENVPEMIARAYQFRNAARNLLVKGRQDYVAGREGIHATVDHPCEEALEAIGGTGDTLTGIVTALAAAGTPLREAAVAAAKINRLAGFHARPTPATQVIDIIARIPRAAEDILSRQRSMEPV